MGWRPPTCQQTPRHVHRGGEGGGDTPHSHGAADMKCDSWTMAVNTNESQTSRRGGQPTPRFSYWRWASDTNSRLLTSFLLCCLRVRGGDVTFSLCKNTTRMQTFMVCLTPEQLPKQKAALSLQTKNDSFTNWFIIEAHSICESFFFNKKSSWNIEYQAFIHTWNRKKIIIKTHISSVQIMVEFIRNWHTETCFSVLQMQGCRRCRKTPPTKIKAEWWINFIS